MLDQPTQRTNEWLCKATISGIRGTDFHHEQPGLRGNLVNPNEKTRILTMASLLMVPSDQLNGSESKSPIVKVVRDTTGPLNNKCHIYGPIGDESKVLEYVKFMKDQIEKWSGKTA